MKKSEVYSWRLTPELKSRLENAARAEEVSFSGLLEGIAEKWLAGHRDSDGEEERQRRLQTAAAATFGTLRGGDPTRASRARELVRARLREQRES